MEIPWIYYVNILLIPILFGYLTAFSLSNSFRPRVSTYGWTMFYVFADGFGLGLQSILGFRRLVMADTWDYSLIVIAISFAIMQIVIIISKTPLRRFFPTWVPRNEIEESEIPVEKPRKKWAMNTFRIIFFLVWILFLVVFFALRWYEQTFNVDFDALLYTIAAPTKGTGNEVVETAMLKIIPPIVIFAMLYWVSYLSYKKRSETEILVIGRKRECINPVHYRRLLRLVNVVSIIFFVIAAAVILKLPQYIRSISQMSTIYEEHYVDPDNVKLVAEGEQRNLILIILESMETTYTTLEEGGIHDRNYIPRLTALANENISFSNTNGIGGFQAGAGTGWTMAATIALSSGVPFQFPVGQNSLGRYESIAGGLTTLGDILEEKGYALEAVFGTDASFAGTADYFEQHGGYKVFDLDDFYAKKYVDEDFYEWWGVRDEILYKGMKDELTEISQGDKPFAVTMFTMDTHATAGYLCEICPEKYKNNQLGNVLECTDIQIDSFISWCKEQPWYDNTTIVITGDHPRMDSRLIGSLEPLDRRVYNCFINSAKTGEFDLKNRVFTTLDMFPTIVSAMGFDIPGNMLGLGTDLLSGQKTLAEQYGLDWMNEQLSMKSNYYITNFY